jgi:1-acyl-sn-glycerol-3-phosphate acyltransferase
MKPSGIFLNRQYNSMFWTQFLGALNDNFFKNALVVTITFNSITIWGLDHKNLVALTGGVFILPFFIFSAMAGQLADKYEKSKIIIYTKLLEIIVMSLAAVAIYYQAYEVLIVVLFLMGTQSTFFGPVKYAILPDIVDETQLIGANAYVEIGTFLAILLGTIAGGVVSGLPNGHWWLTLGLLAFSVAGFVTSLKMKPVIIAAPHLLVSWNPLLPTWRIVSQIRKDSTIYHSIFGISWFWAFGAMFLSLLPVYGRDFLHGHPFVVTGFLAIFTVGIGLGSFICERLSKQQIELALVPIGSLGMSIFLFDLGLALPPSTILQDSTHILTLSELASSFEGQRILFDLLAISIFGGFFTVPLYTLMQQRSSHENRARTIAANNIINALFMVAGSLALMGFYSQDLTLPQIFMVIALLNGVVAIYIYSVVPEFTLRFYTWILVHILYRVRAIGSENIPRKGPVLLVCNHVSFVDWLIILGMVRRPTHFVIYYKFFNIPGLRWLLKQAGVIPIAGRREDPDILEASFAKIKVCLARGEVVCIFPEGMITRNGELNVFRPGILKILNESPVPVVPMAIQGLWGSLFSYKGGKVLKKLPRRFWHRVHLLIGTEIAPAEASLERLQSAINCLLNES